MSRTVVNACSRDVHGFDGTRSTHILVVVYPVVAEPYGSDSCHDCAASFEDLKSDVASAMTQLSAVLAIQLGCGASRYPCLERCCDMFCPSRCPQVG